MGVVGAIAPTIFEESPFYIEFASTVLKESRLLGNEMIIHPHFEIPKATPVTALSLGVKFHF